MPPPSAEIVGTYTKLLQHAIWNLRMRLRSGEEVSPEELVAFLNAIENVPAMLLNYGEWNVEENIDWHLAHYDDKWLNREDSQLRLSLVSTLRQIKDGRFTPPTEKT
jgi:hypothetical protein